MRCLLLLPIFTTLLLAQALSALDTTREFYAWYVPIAQKSDGLAAVLKQRPNALTSTLASALKADRAASAKVKDEIVGLDGDPSLDTQDPCERYEVGPWLLAAPEPSFPSTASARASVFLSPSSPSNCCFKRTSGRSRTSISSAVVT